MKVSRQQFEDANRAAAEVILSNPVKYGGEGALLVQWARLFIERQQGLKINTNKGGQQWQTQQLSQVFRATAA